MCTRGLFQHASVLPEWRGVDSARLCHYLDVRYVHPISRPTPPHHPSALQRFLLSIMEPLRARNATGTRRWGHFSRQLCFPPTSWPGRYVSAGPGSVLRVPRAGPGTFRADVCGSASPRRLPSPSPTSWDEGGGDGTEPDSMSAAQMRLAGCVLRAVLAPSKRILDPLLQLERLVPSWQRGSGDVRWGLREGRWIAGALRRATNGELGGAQVEALGKCSCRVRMLRASPRLRLPRLRLAEALPR